MKVLLVSPGSNVDFPRRIRSPTLRSVVGLALIVGGVVDGGAAGDISITRDGYLNTPRPLGHCIIIGAELNQRGGRGRGRVERPEESMFLLGDARGEVESVGTAAVGVVHGGVVAELQRPKLINHDAVARFILERAEESAAGVIVSMDARIAFAEIAHQQRAAEDAETGRRLGDAPGRIERTLLMPKSGRGRRN